MLWEVLFAIYQYLAQFFSLVINVFFAFAYFLTMLLNIIPFTTFLLTIVPGIIGVGIVTAISIAVIKILAKVG